jgi:hypothetical protein
MTILTIFLRLKQVAHPLETSLLQDLPQLLSNQRFESYPAKRALSDTITL